MCHYTIWNFIDTCISLTVLGLIEPSELGITLTHEHISMTFEFMYCDPPKGDDKNSTAPFTLENSGWIHQYPLVFIFTVLPNVCSMLSD